MLLALAERHKQVLAMVILEVIPASTPRLLWRKVAVLVQLLLLAVLEVWLLGGREALSTLVVVVMLAQEFSLAAAVVQPAQVLMVIVLPAEQVLRP